MNIVILSRSFALYSTQSLYRAAVNRGHFVQIIDHMMCDLFIENEKFGIKYLGEDLGKIDAIIPRIGINATDYGSFVIRQFELMNVITSLKSESLIRTRNKFGSLQLLARAGIPIPDTAISWNYDNLTEFVNNFGDHPAVIKLLSSTHGEGVIKSDNPKTSAALMEAFIKLNHDVLIQRFIKESSGTDIRAFVVDNKLVAAMERIAQEGEFRSNIHRGAVAKPVILTKSEVNIARESANILGLDVAGVDIMRSNNGPMVIEVNASPGLEGIETTTKVNVAKKIINYLESKYKSNANRD